MLNRILVGVLVLGTGGIAATLAGQDAATSSLPEWTRGACWYRIIVTRFHNGDSTNDPQDTQRWPSVRQVRYFDPSPTGMYELRNEHYGGDLQGLRARLPYLKQLGIDVLYLSPIFVAPSEHNYDPADLRHVDDMLAVANSLGKIKNESDDPSSWQFSQSDQLFLEFVKEAHTQGFRVVLENVFSQAGVMTWARRDILRKKRRSPCADWFRMKSWDPRPEWDTDNGYGNKLIPLRLEGDGFSPGAEAHLHAVTKRWMDPNGDGDPSDGIDGWAVFDAPRMPRATLQRWRQVIRRINPDAVLIGDFVGVFPMKATFAVPPAADEFDLTIDYSLSDSLGRFFHIERVGTDSEGLIDSLMTVHSAQAESDRRGTISAVSAPSLGRLLNKIAHDEPSMDTTAAEAGAYDNWRLAMAVHFLGSSNPMLYYGDEAGMDAHGGSSARQPMKWDDLPGGVAKSSDPNASFAGMIRQLNNIRRRFAPLSRGDFRRVPFDEERPILVFARSLPGDKVIVIINGGKGREEVALSIGWPGRMVGIVNPELSPGPLHPLLQKKQIAAGGDKKSALRLFGSRQFADEWGDITVTVSPQSIRLVIVKDEEPRG